MMKEQIEFNVKIKGPNECGNFDIIEVNGMPVEKSRELKTLKATFEETRNVQIQMAYVTSSPGHWIVISGLRFWVP